MNIDYLTFGKKSEQTNAQRKLNQAFDMKEKVTCDKIQTLKDQILKQKEEISLA